VSRVGGKTQAPALREATASFRLEYAQFLELELFTRFGGVADARVQAQITRGERLRALLVQPQFAPLRLVDEVALALALRAGVFDASPVSAVAGVRRALPQWLDAHATDASALRGAVAALLAQQSRDG
jgi:F-type H+-transporting ATPase subunit alpha